MSLDSRRGEVRRRELRGWMRRELDLLLGQVDLVGLWGDIFEEQRPSCVE